MHKKMLTGVVGAILALGLVGTTSAGAATSYSNCDSLHRAHRYGVAKSQKAATKQVNSGHYKPYVSYNLYVSNSHLDADKDATACEVTR